MMCNELAWIDCDYCVLFETPSVVNGSNALQLKLWKGASTPESSDSILKDVFSDGPDFDGC